MARDYDNITADRTWVWWAVAIVAVLAALFFLIPALADRAANVAQTDENMGAGGEADAVGGADPTPSISDILDNPIALEGNMVTVTGEVERFAGARAFILDEFGIAEDQILVITLDQSVPFEEGAQIAVTGTVRRGAVADVEREYGVDLSREYEAEIENRPFIVASSIAAR